MSLSNAFSIETPRNYELNNRWRHPGTGLAEHRFPRLDQSSSTIVRCGGGLEDGDDAKKAASDTLRISPTTAIANWYMNQLNDHELRTKFVSSGIMALVADVCAQKVGHSMNSMSSIVGSSNAVFRLDKQRMVAMFVDGLVCTGPLLHYVYEFYEWVIPTHGDKTKTEDNRTDDYSASKGRFLAVLVHVLFDNLVMCIVYIAVLMVTTALLEGRHAVIPQELMHDLIPAVKVSWKVSIMGFAPLQLLSFHCLPMKLRVLAVNVLDVVWVTVMSYVTHLNRH